MGVKWTKAHRRNFIAAMKAKREKVHHNSTEGLKIAQRAALKHLRDAYKAELRTNGGELTDLIVRAYAVCEAFA